MAKILAIIGLLLFAVLVLIVLLLCLRVAASVRVRNEGIWIRLQIGLLHKTITPRIGRRASGKKSEEKTQARQEELDESGLPELDWGDVLCEGLSLLDDVKDRLRIDVLRVELLVATGDAARTGLYLGGLSALGGIIYPFLEKNFHIRDFGVQVDGDFEGSATQYDLRLGCSFRPIRMIGVALRHGRRHYHMLKQKQSVEAK